MMFDEKEMIEVCKKYGINVSKNVKSDTNISMKKIMNEHKIDYVEEKLKGNG